MNPHYKNRYDKFIKIVKDRKNRSPNGYTEIHHIQPRCLGGSNLSENLIELSLREHFLAHWLLWKAYPTYLPLVSAFLQMNNKNPKTGKPFQGKITSKTYEQLKTQAYVMISEFMTNKVHLKDESGRAIIMTRSEYAAQDRYRFHTTGKIYVLDTDTNLWVYIPASEYQKNQHRYKVRQGKYRFIDTKTNEIIKITKLEARQKNHEAGSKRFVHIQKKKVKCISESGEYFYVTLKEYNSDIHKAYNNNTLVVFDQQENKNKKITTEEYNLCKNRYTTSTKGKVVAKDPAGNTVLISKEEFNNSGYIGQTKGLTTVFDKVLGKYLQISQGEFNQNRDKYSGPTSGKVNVVDKQTGKRQQIPKDQFDKNKHCALGNKKFLFLCRNKLTCKEKYINIYEWETIKHQYDIIDTDKFIKILDLL
jgi:hypothetical protein